MYITADLFDEPSHPSPNEQHATHNWRGPPMMHPTDGLGKRKRHYADPSLYSRPRTYGTLPFESPCSHTIPMCTTTPKYTACERRPAKQIRRHGVRAPLAKSTSHLMDLEPDLPLSVSIESKSISTSDLRPCHACRSAPKRRKDLENYLDCTRCDGRTCFICARQCYGECNKAICKKCVVEVGQEGDPWCLDCYSRNINA